MVSSLPTGSAIMRARRAACSCSVAVCSCLAVRSSLSASCTACWGRSSPDAVQGINRCLCLSEGWLVIVAAPYSRVHKVGPRHAMLNEQVLCHLFGYVAIFLCVDNLRRVHLVHAREA